MESTSINFPEVLDIQTTSEFIDQLRLLPDSGSFVFDFANAKRFEPFALLCLSFEIRRLREIKPRAKIFAINYTYGEANSYAAHMGFFKAMGLDYGKEAADLSENDQYIPITVKNIDQLKREAADRYMHVSELIEKDSGALAFMLCREREGNLFDTLEYLLREMLRNVVEHSQAKKIYYCAQAWPKKNKIEIAIFDSGIGMKESLSSNPFLAIDSDKNALYLSLLPGVSGKMYKGKKRNANDVWENSGYGLYMTSELCRNAGSFFVASGDAGLLLSKETKEDMPSNLHGTALRLVFDTKNIPEISRSLRQYKEKGESLAAQIKGANITASAASSMLSEMLKYISK